VLDDGTVLHQHKVASGDIWRSASTRKAPIEDWVQLAIDRQKATGYRAIFWLDEDRAHDAELISFVKPILEAKGVADKFEIMSPRDATRASLETITKGENTIAITGNVLRDYLTDLFPILELATSAKMLSIVKLMNGGGLFETGAGGSAPKHVQAMHAENHLRWDSLGEFCALGESFKFFAEQSGNDKARILGDGVEAATQGYLDNDNSPQRKPGQPDNRNSHYWFARYWAEYLAAQDEDAELAAHFSKVAQELSGKEDQIMEELMADRGKPVDQGGYYHPDPEKTAAIMRPSPTFNAIIG
jgi:isocitrate dehydrogenase